MERAKARRSDPQTSQEAAANKAVGADQLKTLRVYWSRFPKPLLARDIVRITGHDGLWKRVSELEQKKLLQVVGDAIDPETKARARTFQLTAAGIEVVGKAG